MGSSCSTTNSEKNQTKKLDNKLIVLFPKGKHYYNFNETK